MQETAFSQCFNYVNWTGSIKVPAIMQYAKKLAKFSSEVMEPNSTIPESLASKLYDTGKKEDIKDAKKRVERNKVLLRVHLWQYLKIFFFQS